MTKRMRVVRNEKGRMFIPVEVPEIPYTEKIKKYDWEQFDVSNKNFEKYRRPTSAHPANDLFAHIRTIDIKKPEVNLRVFQEKSISETSLERETIFSEDFPSFDEARRAFLKQMQIKKWRLK